MKEYHLNISPAIPVQPSTITYVMTKKFLHRDGVTNDRWYAAEISNLDTSEIMTAIYNFIKRM
jgi:hypothetical protein